jgi:hypothetical protein
MDAIIASAVLVLLTGASTSACAQEKIASEELAHTRVEFKFTVNVPFEQAAPLFGANEERK